MKIAVLSDIHGNLEALMRVLNEISEYDAIVVLGDLVDYGPDPEEVVDLTREIDAITVRGNHDHAAAFNIDCGCGEKTHDISVYTREKITIPQISEDQKRYLASLPLTMSINLGDRAVALVHGSMRSPLYGYVYPWTIKEELCQRSLRMRSEIAEECDIPYDIVLLGHTHHQFTIRLGRTLIVNPGSVGQPRDGDPRASFSVIDLDGEKIGVNLFRVKYDIERTMRKLEARVDDKVYLEKLKRILIEGRVF